MGEKGPRFAQGVITDEAIEEHRKRIGRKQVSAGRGEYATQDSIRQFVNAIGDLNPLYRDEEYAKKTRYGRLVAPPSFLRVVGGGGIGLGLRGVLAFHSGTEWVFHKPIYPGDKFTCESEFIELQEKGGRFAPRWLQEIFETKYTDQRAEVVATAYMTIARTERSRVSARTRGEEKTAKREQPHPWTEEERIQIEDEMIKSSEEIRGSEPRYWEDVNEDDELPQLVKGPLRLMDMVAWFGATEVLLGCASALKLFRKVPGLALVHPDSNAREYIEFVHCNRGAAEFAGFPNAYDWGAQRHHFLMQQLTNWMGDDGWLKRCLAQYRGFVFISDVLRFNSKVIEKYVDEDGEYCVDILSSCLNQAGENVMPSRSTIALPSREKGIWPVERRLR